MLLHMSTCQVTLPVTTAQGDVRTFRELFPLSNGEKEIDISLTHHQSKKTCPNSTCFLDYC